MLYAIWSESERLWWSNENGWVETDASLFTKKERDSFNLPIGGKWYNLTSGELE